MKVESLQQLDCLTLYTETSLDKEIGELYTCDLLSWVMGHVHEPNTVLLTVLNSMNAVAVASLLDMSAIIFCENVVPTQDIIDKANEEDIPIFKSSLSTFETAYLIRSKKA